MILRAPKDWPKELASFIIERSSKRFAWDWNNCAFFVCDWLLIRTGIDPAASFRGGTTSALSAARTVRRFGGLLAIAESACDRWGWREQRPNIARRGDIAFARLGRFEALGVCVGQKTAFVADVGLTFINNAQCARAWRIE